LKLLTRRAGLLVAGALLAGPVLVGCDQPKTAAVVGPETISQEQLATLVEEYNFIYSLATGAPPEDVDAILTQAIVDRIAANLLAETGNQALVDSAQALTPGEFADWVEQNEVADAAAVERVKALDQESFNIATNLRVALLQEVIDAGEVSSEQLDAALADVSVNPRYGEWPTGEEAAAAVSQVDRPWLISLAALTAAQNSAVAPAPVE
jgi:hypothetical protein